MPVQDHFGGKPHSAAFEELEAGLEAETSVTYRKLRDMWLQAAFKPDESAALPAPWRQFCLSSLAWAADREIEALRLLDEGSKTAPRWFWMRYYVAEILLRRLDLYEMARAEIQAVVQRVPWLWEARCLWAENLMAVGHPEPLKAVRPMTVPEHSRAAFLAWRGALRLWWGEYDAAVADLDPSAAMNNPDALCWRGGALCKLGRLEESKRDLDKLLAMDPHDPEALVWSGETHRLLGDHKRALEDLGAVIAISGDKPWAHVNRALITLGKKDVLGAWRDFAGAWLPHLDVTALESCPLTAKQLEKLLTTALKESRGCRRSDPHLNAGWMRAAGVPLPPRPLNGGKITPWARFKGLPVPTDGDDDRKPAEWEVRALLAAPSAAR